MVRSFFNRGREKINIRSKEKESSNADFTLKISKNLTTNTDNLTNMLDNPTDLQIRELKLGKSNIRCAIAYIDGIVDEQGVQQNILGSIEQVKEEEYPDEPEKILEFIYSKIISVNNVEKAETFDELSFSILSGYTILYLDGITTVLLIETAGGEFRSIEEPVTETLIRGPREGFVESIHKNLSMIRRRISNPNLRFKTYQTGRRSRKNLVVAYIDGIVHPELVNEINRRLKTIDIDNVPESGYIEEWSEDSFLSPFPQMMHTERPDKIIAAMMQGKVGIFVDCTLV